MANTDGASFIPNSSNTNRRTSYSGNGGSWLMLVGFGVFCIALLLSVGVFLYKQYAISNRDSTAQELEQAQSAFEPSLIGELDQLGSKIDAASNLLDRHVALTPLFPIIEEVTLESVQFDSMQLSFAEGDGAGQNQASSGDSGTGSPMLSSADITLSGTGPGYASVALQATEFAEHDQITNSILSSFSLSETGDVVFELQFQVPRSVLTYQNTI